MVRWQTTYRGRGNRQPTSAAETMLNLRPSSIVSHRPVTPQQQQAQEIVAIMESGQFTNENRQAIETYMLEQALSGWSQDSSVESITRYDELLVQGRDGLGGTSAVQLGASGVSQKQRDKYRKLFYDAYSNPSRNHIGNRFEGRFKKNVRERAALVAHAQQYYWQQYGQLALDISESAALEGPPAFIPPLIRKSKRRKYYRHQQWEEMPKFQAALEVEVMHRMAMQAYRQQHVSAGEILQEKEALGMGTFTGQGPSLEAHLQEMKQQYPRSTAHERLSPEGLYLLLKACDQGLNASEIAKTTLGQPMSTEEQTSRLMLAISEKTAEKMISVKAMEGKEVGEVQLAIYPLCTDEGRQQYETMQQQQETAANNDNRNGMFRPANKLTDEMVAAYTTADIEQLLGGIPGQETPDDSLLNQCHYRLNEPMYYVNPGYRWTVNASNEAQVQQSLIFNQQVREVSGRYRQAAAAHNQRFLAGCLQAAVAAETTFPKNREELQISHDVLASKRGKLSPKSLVELMEQEG